ncbi:histone-like nucleoid-structuring protein Lsr2 [Microbacterium karelineae]|uniref:histone-like nucleoid-structuring protein Lsr2 n=1 Tax=Microbacterium karelineae TaxID=2654283 RepID=UPI0012EA6434|nr:Lsr2 family protein [Microbacterium karelineae]
MKRTVHLVVDDLDGSTLPAGEGETIEFGLDGATYEIDLGADNAAALREALGAYVEAARDAGGAAAPKSRPTTAYTVTHLPTTRPRGENARIRKWARKHGHDVAERGAIPQSVRDAFHARG